MDYHELVNNCLKKIKKIKKKVFVAWISESFDELNEAGAK